MSPEVGSLLKPVVHQRQLVEVTSVVIIVSLMPKWPNTFDHTSESLFLELTLALRSPSTSNKSVLDILSKYLIEHKMLHHTQRHSPPYLPCSPPCSSYSTIHQNANTFPQQVESDQNVKSVSQMSGSNHLVFWIPAMKIWYLASSLTKRSSFLSIPVSHCKQTHIPSANIKYIILAVWI